MNEKYQQNIVSIVPKRENPAVTPGTGIIMNARGWTLTTYHLVDFLHKDPALLDQHRIKRGDGTLYEIDPSFFAWDDDYDLALLKTKHPVFGLPDVPIRQQDLRLDEMLRYYSFAGGREIQEHKGKVVVCSEDILIRGKDKEKIRRDSVVFAGRAEVGYSGSPLFANGELSGLLFGADNQGHVFATKARYIAALIEYARQNKL